MGCVIPKPGVGKLAPDLLGSTGLEEGERGEDAAVVLVGLVQVADGRVWMLPSGVPCFCGDLPEEEQQPVYATHYAPAADLFARNAPGVAWRSKPSWYIVANNDQTVNPELERFAAKRQRRLWTGTAAAST